MLDFLTHSLFIRPMFLIVAGGDPPGGNLLAGLARKARKVIAADKGAMYCLESGVVPHLVVGDLDSLTPGIQKRLQDLGVEIKKFSTSKDYTDTQLALDEAISGGARNVEIIGAMGGRFDHELANLHLLKRALDAGINARISTDTQQIFLIRSEHYILNRQGCTASFLPLTGRVEGITLAGFAYELEGAAMEIGNPYGTSNIVRNSRARVSVGEGVLVAVLSGFGPISATGE
jgi:thiamine pyrophosphokinase